MKRTPLRARPPVDHSGEPGYRAWHEPMFGPCAGCGERDRLIRHHVVLAQHVAALGADVWDIRNSLLLGAGFQCGCHRDHHSACARLPVSRLPAAAIAFAAELLGEAQAADYLARYYSAD